MTTLAITVFVASLLGSMHCVGMCGPLAMLASGVSRESARAGVRRNLVTASYHGGRVIAYAVAGFLAGWIGSGIQNAGDWLGTQRLAAQLAGGSMLLVGLLSLYHLMNGSTHSAWLPMPVQKGLAVGHAWARKQPPLRRALLIGILTALLPCGWLYTFLLVAAGTASPWNGSLVMAVFALGSVPALVGLVLSTRLLVGRFRNAIPWFSAILVTVVGGMTMIQRGTTDLSKVHPPRARASVPALIRYVQSVDQEKLPCCEPASGNESAQNRQASEKAQEGWNRSEAMGSTDLEGKGS